MLNQCKKTWSKKDGIPMVDYSSQNLKKSRGSHADHLDRSDFTNFLKQSKPYDFDLMLEIKDKELSAVQALMILESDPRMVRLG